MVSPGTYSHILNMKWCKIACRPDSARTRWRAYILLPDPHLVERGYKPLPRTLPLRLSGLVFWPLGLCPFGRRTNENNKLITRWEYLNLTWVLSYACPYPLNRNCFRFRGYLWISVIKQQRRGRARHIRVFSSRDEFLVSAVVVPVSILTSMLYANLLAQTISEINREY